MGALLPTACVSDLPCLGGSGRQCPGDRCAVSLPWVLSSASSPWPGHAVVLSLGTSHCSLVLVASSWRRECASPAACSEGEDSLCPGSPCACSGFPYKGYTRRSAWKTERSALVLLLGVFWSLRLFRSACSLLYQEEERVSWCSEGKCEVNGQCQYSILRSLITSLLKTKPSRV